MKIVVIGDIHGRECWKQIVENNPDADKIIFLGDYVSTHDEINEEKQISNLIKILEYKESNPDKVVLLRGNHDIQHLGYYWARCSGYFPKIGEWLSTNKDRFLEDTQWIYIDGRNLFSHAGVTNEWLADNNLTLETINGEEVTEKFGFQDRGWSTNCYGDNVFQSPLWVRPYSLSIDCLTNYVQLVGHTRTARENVIACKPVFNEEIVYKDSEPCRLDDIKDTGEYVILCDCLPYEYLVIEDNKYISVKL